MRKIRIGNDIAVQWSLVAKGTGEPFALEGKDIRLTLKNIFAKTTINEFDVAGNTISWTFKGSEQKQVGIYSLEVSLLDEQGVMITTDVCDFVELVACSCEIGGMDATGVHTEYIELVSDVDVAAGIDLANYLTKTEAQATYQPQEKGKGLSTNDYTTAEKNKLAGLQNYDDTEIRQELTELSERIDGLEGGGSSVFEAIYGATTYDEIVAAHNEGKVVLCKFNGYVARLSQILDSTLYLNAISGNILLRITCFKAGSWSYNSYNAGHEIKDLVNGNVELTISGTKREVATPQYVENAIQQSGGGGSSSDKQGVIRQTQKWTQAADKGYDYVMQDIVRGSIPSYFIDLWKSRGGDSATFNEETGYFEYETLKDISYEEALTIYSSALPVFQASIFANKEKCRAFLPQVSNGEANGSISINNAFIRNLSLEFCTMADLDNHEMIVNNIGTAFFGSYKLRHIGGVIRVKSISSLGNDIFSQCYSLEELQLKEIKASIGFGTCSRLSNASILYMIKNEIATSAITITLHADAYERAMADADIQAALAAHPNVSLAK